VQMRSPSEEFREWVKHRFLVDAVQRISALRARTRGPQDIPRGGSKVYLTGLHGWLRITSDGASYRVETGTSR